MLWPGESHTFWGVKMTWEVPAQDQNATGPVGVLKFVGPKTALNAVTPPVAREANRQDRGKGVHEIIGFYMRTANPIMVYLDGVFFRINGRVNGPAANLDCKAELEPSEQKFSGAPTSMDCPISSVCPISLNQWKLTLSDKPVKYPDGAEYLELTGVDSETNAKMTLPAAQSATRRFGRFDIAIQQIDLPNRTARLRVSVQPDLTIRGGDTYVASPGGDLEWLTGETNTTYFERIAKKYGIEVNWAERPDVPGAAQLLKQKKEEAVQFSHSMQAGLLREMLGPPGQQKANVSDLVFKWADATHLEVSPNYDALVAKNKAQSEREDWEKRFQAEYALQTRVFALRFAPVATAKGLIEPLFKTYYLIADEMDGRAPGMRGIEPNLRYRIDTAQPNLRNGLTQVLMTVAERCVPDERTNALIVVATRETMDGVQEMLQRVDVGVPQAQAAPALVGRYRIEVVLLQGGKAGEKIEDVSRATKLSFAVAGMVRDVSARTGMKVNAGEVLMRLDPRDQEMQVQQAQIELMQAQAEMKVADSTAARYKHLRDTGQISQDEAEKAQYALTAAQAKIDTGRLKLQTAELRLGNCTLLAPTSGTVVSVLVNPNERVEAGQVVLTFLPTDTGLVAVMERTVPQLVGTRKWDKTVGTAETGGTPFPATVEVREQVVEGQKMQITSIIPRAAKRRAMQQQADTRDLTIAFRA